jgi:hypothetical protein
MMDWDRRMVVADGMINGLGYDDIRAKLVAAGAAAEGLPSDDSMRTYRDSREFRAMLSERMTAQRDHQQAALCADRVGSLIDINMVEALEGMRVDLRRPETTLMERIAAVRVLAVYRRQLFLERQAGDVKPDQANHRVLESDMENPAHILFEPDSLAVAAAGQPGMDQWRPEPPPAPADESGSVAMSGDESGCLAVSGDPASPGPRRTDESGCLAMSGDESGSAGISVEESVRRTMFYQPVVNPAEVEDEAMIQVSDVNSMSQGELYYLLDSDEFGPTLVRLLKLSEAQADKWVASQFPGSGQDGIRLLWRRLLSLGRQANMLAM